MRRHAYERQGAGYNLYFGTIAVGKFLHQPFRLFSRVSFECQGVAMCLAPLLDAARAIQLHAFAAMAAFALGVVQFAHRRGRCRTGRLAGSGSC